MKLFFTGPVVKTELLVVMLEKHGIAATQEFADPRRLVWSQSLAPIADGFVPAAAPLPRQQRHLGGDGATSVGAGAAKFFQRLVAGEVLRLNFLEALPQGLEFAAAPAAFFADARAACGQHINFVGLWQEFDA